MSRGYFDFVGTSPAYKGSRKFWYVPLVQSDCFWFDLIVNPPKVENDEDFIASYLADLKKHVEETLERRFIYFFCSRPKVRFDTQRKPHYEWFRGCLVVNLLIGREKKKKAIRVKLFDGHSFLQAKPQSK